ncbi:MAG: FAD-dependent oxidoreductase [Acidiferrobacteraceae bacterium]|nr:FAD-dependent oxidoreductase [Acidiferrobacteraceae bacterium]
MNIAIIGAGVSGLVTAYILGKEHNVTVFEKERKSGGHAQTTQVHDDGKVLPIDTGFIVFNAFNYPILSRLFEALGVKTHNSNMSFSVRYDRDNFEYNGSSLNKLFAQRKNIFRPDMWRMLRDILEFNRKAKQCLDKKYEDTVTVSDYLTAEGYSQAFVERYLLPLGASIWSSDCSSFSNFPIKFVIEFLDNHSLLQLRGRPQWKTVTGGSQQYIGKLEKSLEGKLRHSTAVQRVTRKQNGVEVYWNDDSVATFDEVIMATHADTSISTVADIDKEEHDVLSMFPYQSNQACLHTDTRVLPSKRRTWASWNYLVRENFESAVCVTYNMNLLQGFTSSNTYCVSLNQEDLIRENRIIERMQYRHPMFSPGRDEAQRKHSSLIRRRGISYCGSYWGSGFHEDGIRSALNVCDAFGVKIPF